MKILHVAESVKGGVATYLNVLNSCLSEDKKIKNYYFIPFLQSNELDVRKKIFHDGGRGYNFPRFVCKLYKIIKIYQPNVIYAHSSFSGLALAIVRVFLPNIYTIYCPHGWAVFRKQLPVKKWIIIWIEKKMSLAFDVVVNISNFEHEKTYELGYRGNRVCINNTILDFSSPPPLYCEYNDMELRPINLLFVGRFDFQKGLDILIEALSYLNKDEVKFKLVVVGESVLYNEKFSLKNSEWLKIEGWKRNDELNVFYQKTDLLVVPSRWEGFGLVVLEAYKNATPVLVSNVGALPELVDKDTTGYVFDPNSKELIGKLKAISLRKLIKMKPLCRKKYTDNYHVSEFKRKQFNILENILNN